MARKVSPDWAAQALAEAGYNDSGFLRDILLSEFEHKSPAAVRQEAKVRSEAIFSSYDTLHEIMIRHEATIRKRWGKKIRPQRLKILLNAWPGMPVMHRPDFDAIRKCSARGQYLKADPQYRSEFIWPYINQEDLVQPKTLLLLLNARGRHPPFEFSGTDGAAMHLGHVTKAIIPIFLSKHVMIIDGATNATDYGRLISWEDHPHAFVWMMTRKQYLPGEGLLVLEAQERLLKFLVDCCKQILHDVPEDTLTTDAFPVQPEPAIHVEGESSGLGSLALLAAEAPYRVPTHLDLGRIVSLLGARESAAEDHLWALREDPSYFAEQLEDAKEHRSEMLKDINGDIHPTLRPGHETTFWARLIGQVVASAYAQLEAFSELRRQAKNLQELQQKHRSNIDPTKDLPQEYRLAILKFRHYADKLAQGHLAVLRDEVPASPPLRSRYVRCQPWNSTSSEMDIRLRRIVKGSTVELETNWLLSTLMVDGFSLFLISMPLILDELERLLQAEKSASDLLSARVAGTIGDLSILSQCINQIDLYLPWARTFEHVTLDQQNSIDKDYTETFAPWQEISAALQADDLQEVATLANPLRKKFFYPVEKRRTKENVETLRLAERNLDDVWDRLDRLMHAKCGKMDRTAARQLLSQPRILQRTPPWTAKAPVATKQQEQKLDDLDTLYRPLSTLYFGLHPQESKDAQDIQRTKQKTRGVPQQAQPPTSPSSPLDTELANTEPQPAPITVDSKSFKVFRTLFFNPESTSTPGEIAWADFLHAMTSTGLFSADKLYGSVWQFERSDGLGLGRIQFHEPHPRGKIPFTIARRYGRRLNRAFGWSGETFRVRRRG
ncbi:uncharacterized protein GGS25DRAFT_528173 [Hypoxylon fragiforme]|uniref:uncharacterized protein n=1 Tax=Hypoxylon fragiforme TaxID=63214 RepID=UPI0020C5ECA7|nr:uncharacterized protein GGS25DRAFT_528173 [Hypoxylon fragiforme]KAI2603147.1 hypothetical protein GGS25DRAFT_528173 [Hypoxylon fragiforme]